MDVASIAEALEAGLTVAPRGGIEWFGTEYGRLAPSVWRSMADETRTAFRTALISNHLYPHLYCYGQVVADLGELPVRDDGSEQLASLERADQGGVVADTSWVVTAAEDGGSVVAARAGIQARFPSSSVRQGGEGLVVLTATAEPHLSPGFFLVRGRTDLDFSTPTYRFYLSLTPAGRVASMRYLTEALNDAGMAFRYKVISRVGEPHRADSAVLYVAEPDLDLAAATVAVGVQEWAEWTVPTSPTLSKPLAPGIGFAQDPGSGVSFGESRCRVIARAWVAWHGEGARSGGLHARILEQLELAGHDAVRPHLDVGGCDITFPLVERARRPFARTASLDVVDTDDALLQVALRGGDVLVDRAIWSEDRCQWVGTSPSGAHAPGPLAGTLEADLYGGLAGIALFLVRLGTAVDADRYVGCGLGAARRALDSVGRTVEAGGYYSGSSGVLAALAAIADATGSSSFGGDVERAVDQYLATDVRADEPDLLVGDAGEIVALLQLGEIFGRSDCVDRALALAHELADGAVELGDGIGWPVGIEGPPRLLAGFTHGGAGIAYALLRAQRTRPDDTRLLDTAQRAFLGEDTFYRSGAANWLDARAGERHERFSFYWCHGLPGILVSRLLAHELVPDDPDLASRVVEATVELRRQLELTDPNTRELGLCHGFCGNAEILDLADPDRRPEIRAHYVSVCGRRGPDVASWPVGRGHGFAPGLLTGFTGIALSFLRMATGATTSVLRP